MSLCTPPTQPCIWSSSQTHRSKLYQATTLPPQQKLIFGKRYFQMTQHACIWCLTSHRFKPPFLDLPTVKIFNDSVIQCSFSVPLASIKAFCFCFCLSMFDVLAWPGRFRSYASHHDSCYSRHFS